jgi:hypothetical protein
MDQTMKTDIKIAGLGIRAWGLILNFIGNILALYGIVGVLQEQKDWGFLVSGLVITVACVSLLAIPTKD